MNYEIYVEMDEEKISPSYGTSRSSVALECFTGLIKKVYGDTHTLVEIIGFWEEKVFDDGDGMLVICEVTES